MADSRTHHLASGSLWVLAAVSCLAIHGAVHIERFLLAAAVTYSVCLAIRHTEDELKRHIDYRARHMFWLSHAGDREKGP